MLAAAAGTEGAPGRAACVTSWDAPPQLPLEMPLERAQIRRKQNLPTSEFTSSEILWDVELAEQKPELQECGVFYVRSQTPAPDPGKIQ